MTIQKNHTYKTTLFSLMALALLALVTAPAAAQQSEDAYRVEKFNVNGPVSLEVSTSGGNIKVVGTDSREVTVEMYVRRRGNYIKPGRADLSSYEIEILQDGNTVTAIARKENIKWNRDYTISFVVHAPTETRTRLGTSGGSVTALNLNGTQELRTSGGRITVEGINGDMVLRTSGGRISINDVRGDVEARTSGGAIRAESIIGATLLQTSGGSIQATGISGSLEARTSGGGITAELLSPDEFVDLRTSGGSINIKIPRKMGYELDLKGNRVNVELNNFSGRTERGRITGTIDGGGTKVSARTSGGSVNLDFN